MGGVECRCVWIVIDGGLRPPSCRAPAWRWSRRDPRLGGRVALIGLSESRSTGGQWEETPSGLKRSRRKRVVLVPNPPTAPALLHTELPQGGRSRRRVGRSGHPSPPPPPHTHAFIRIGHPSRVCSGAAAPPRRRASETLGHEYPESAVAVFSSVAAELLVTVVEWATGAAVWQARWTARAECMGCRG